MVKHSKADEKKTKTELVGELISQRDKILSLEKSKSKFQKELKLIRKSIEDYRLLIENLFDSIIKIDTEGKLLFVNPAYCQLLGKNEEELLGSSSFALIHDEEKTLAQNEMQKLLHSVFEYYIEYRMMTTKGWRWIAWSFKSVLNSQNSVAAIVGVGRDVTEQKNIANALGKNDERFEFFLEQTSEGISYLSVDPPLPKNLSPRERAIHYLKFAKIAQANKSFVQMYGYEKPEEVIGKKITDFWTGTFDEMIEGTMPWAKNDFKLENQISVEKDKNGNALYFLNNTVGVFSNDRLIALWNSQRDITEQTIMRNKLVESEELYKTLFYSNPIPMWVMERHSLKFLEINDAAVKQYGFSRDEFLKMTAIDICAEDDIILFTNKTLYGVVEPEHPGYFNHRTKDGTVIKIEIASHPLIYDGKKAVLVLANDISERMFVSNALQSIVKGTNNIGKEFLESLVKELSGLLDCKYTFVAKFIDPSFKKAKTVALSFYQEIVNNFEYDLAGTPCQEVLKKEFAYYDNVAESFPDNFMIQELKVTSYMGVALFAQHGHPLGVLIIMNDKPIKNIEFARNFLSIFAARAGAELERLQIEDVLRQNEERLKLALKASDQGLYDLDLTTGIAQIDSGYTSIMGYPATKTEENHDEWIGRVHNDEVFHVLQTFNAYIKGDIDEYRVEARHRTQSGKYKWIQSVGKIVQRSDNGTPTRMVGTYLDVSERKRNDQIIRKYVAALEAKNIELERFTYTVSHDLKSPVITIKGFLGMLMSDARSGNLERLEADIKRISNAADKMQNLLEDLLHLSRIGRIINPSTKFSMAELANETVELLQGGIKEKNIKIIIDNNMPIVLGDRNRIREVYQNLIENSIKYIGNTSKPLIEVGFEAVENGYIFFVKDNGIGIKEDYHEKIFGLFEKLDVSSEGNGIGLAFAKRIVELHGGKIWVESEGTNLGTTFYFTIKTHKNPEDFE